MPHLALADQNFARVKQTLGVTTDKALADTIGFHRVTVAGIKGGDRQPSGEFIATILSMSGLGFTDVFEVRQRKGRKSLVA